MKTNAIITVTFLTNEVFLSFKQIYMTNCFERNENMTKYENVVIVENDSHKGSFSIRHFMKLITCCYLIIL